VVPPASLGGGSQATVSSLFFPIPQGGKRTTGGGRCGSSADGMGQLTPTSRVETVAQGCAASEKRALVWSRNQAYHFNRATDSSATRLLARNHRADAQIPSRLDPRRRTQVVLYTSTILEHTIASTNTISAPRQPEVLPGLGRRRSLREASHVPATPGRAGSKAPAQTVQGRIRPLSGRTLSPLVGGWSP
jgi:hypothetical protein